MKKLLISFVLIALIGCNIQGEESQCVSIRSTSILFSVFNSENEDLLNPENPNHLKGIRIFYVSDKGGD